jgi:hypothetical protein
VTFRIHKSPALGCDATLASLRDQFHSTFVVWASGRHPFAVSQAGLNPGDGTDEWVVGESEAESACELGLGRPLRSRSRLRMVANIDMRRPQSRCLSFGVVRRLEASLPTSLQRALPFTVE